MAELLTATRDLTGIPGVSVAPVWQSFPAAQRLLGSSRAVTPQIAAALANYIGVQWVIMGEISPAKQGYSLLIDFIPARSTRIPFRYTASFRADLMRQHMDEALDQFLRYAQRSSVSYTWYNGPENLQDLATLADTVDREYGWFSSRAVGQSQAEFTKLAVSNHELAAVLFNPDVYLSQAESSAGSGISSQVPPMGTRAPSPPGERGGTSGKKPASNIPIADPSLALVPAPSMEGKSWTVPLARRPLQVLLVGTLRSESQAKEIPMQAHRPGSRASGIAAPAAGDAASGAMNARYQLQVFATTEQEEADQVAERLERKGVDAVIIPWQGKDGVWYRVRIGAFASTKDAAVTGDALQTLGVVNDYWTVAIPTPFPSDPRPAMAGGGRAGGREFQVQVLSSRDRERALALVVRLRQSDLQVQLQEAFIEDKGTYYRVRLTGYSSRAEAVASAERLLARGSITEYWIVD